MTDVPKNKSAQNKQLPDEHLQDLSTSNTPENPRAPHTGYTAPPAMRRRNIITGLTIITVVILMVALAILLPTLQLQS